jgi:hypothetical protein
MSDYGIMRVPVGPAVREARRVEPAGGGWLAFAGILVLVTAVGNAAYAIDTLSAGDTLRGIVFLAIAGAQVLVVLMIIARNPVGAALGIVLAMLNGSIALLTIAHHVGWSLAVMAIDLLAIFGLWAYGLHRPARQRRRTDGLRTSSP